jgi:hypothetical protein
MIFLLKLFYEKTFITHQENYDKIKQFLLEKGIIVQKIFGFLFILLSAGLTVWYPLGKLLG